VFCVLNEISNDKFGFCYDSSHDNLTLEPLTILEKYGSRLIATHISDNYGENDDHMLPYGGLFNWKRFCDLFSNIKLNGIFLLEVEVRKSTFQNTTNFLNEAFSRGNKLLKESCNQ
jgi:sugar phosphate isomerase/epimerase